MATIQQLIDSTSRTFALAIPLLPEPTRRDVTLAYLVFRIVDTLEDAENLEPAQRLKALEEIEDLLHAPSPSRASALATKWASQRPTENFHYRVLLAHAPLVLDELSRRDEPIQRLIRSHACRTAVGMASFLEEGTTHLRSLAELQRYCYFVAGIVGEMLTEIFAARIAGFQEDEEVRSSAQAFGEGLQLVNILKDAEDDARCGRLFLPVDVDRSSIFQLARQDLRQAETYVDRLRESRAPDGYLAFTRLPLQLAAATLDIVERDGPGAKVPRTQVARILTEFVSSSDRTSQSTKPRREVSNPRSRMAGAAAT